MNEKENSIVAQKLYYQSHQMVKMLWIWLPLITLAVALFDLRTNDSIKVMIYSIALLSAINLIILFGIGTLQIRLTDTALQWRYGIFGWPRWQLKYEEIMQVEVTQTQWYEGKGIRFTKEGMLYNADGDGAVRIYKADGKKIRLGSANPEELCAYIQKCKLLSK